MVMLVVSLIVLSAAVMTPSWSGATLPEVRFIVSLDRNEMSVQYGGEEALRFLVATGTPRNPTPKGVFGLRQWIANPSFTPGPEARKGGAVAVAASMDGPLGVAKIPFRGAHQVHAGGNPFSAGKPVTLGCVQLTNHQMSLLGDWLESQGLLSAGEPNERGELRRHILGSLKLIIE